MHTFPGPSGAYYNHNSDMSGDVHYECTVDVLGGPVRVVASIPGEDILALAAQYVRSMKIAQLEQGTDKQILGVEQ